MKLSMSGRALGLLLIALVIITSCRIETAKPSSKRQLIIASDYLTVGDSVLFKDFAKKSKVKVRIVPMETDKIIGTIRNNGANSEIDLIMVKSLYNVYKLDKREILHPINYSEKLPPEILAISSRKYHFVGYGIDPYVFAIEPGQHNAVKTYADLTQFEFINSLEKSEIAPMLSPVLRKMQKVQANKWIMQFMNKSIFPKELTDSLVVGKTILTTYSNFHERAKSDSLFIGKSIIFPNKRTTGTFYSIRTFCIVDQAQNYTEADALIKFYCEPKNNKALNRAMQTISVYSKEYNFRKHAVPAEKLFGYYGMVERVLNKLEKR